MTRNQETAEELALVTTAPDNMVALTTGKDLINLSGDSVVQNTAHLADEQRVLVRWAFEYARDKQWGWKDAEREFGLSTTTLYRIWADKYRYPKSDRRNGEVVLHPKAGERVPLDKLMPVLQKARDNAEEQDAIGRQPFVETSVWHSINDICTKALEWRIIAMIFGDGQIGKTTCLEEHQRRNNHGQTKYVRMPASAGVQLMMKEIARACRVSPESSFEKLRSRVFKAIDRNTLLEIDEVHQLFYTYQKGSMLKCLEVLREIYDRTKCGMVLCGTQVFRTQLETGDYAQFLKQLRRRGVLELQLPAVAPEGDLVAFASGYGLPHFHGEAKALSLAIAKEHGVGRYTKFLEMGARHALKKKQHYTWENFTAAYNIISKLSGMVPPNAERGVRSAE